MKIIGYHRESIENHRRYLIQNSELTIRRSARRKREYLETVEEELGRRLRAAVDNDLKIVEVLKNIEAGAQDPYSAAIELINTTESKSHLDLRGLQNL